MKDKRSSQLTIPMELSPKDAKGYIMQSMRLTFAGTKKISVVAKRMMAKVFEQVKTNDDHFKPYYQMHVTDVVPPDADTSSAYKAVKKAFDELGSQVWIFENAGQTAFTIRNLFDTTREIEKDGYACSYGNGIITVVLNPALEPYLLHLIKEFTVYDLKYYMTFKSWYSMQMYEKLSNYKDTGAWYVSVEDFRKQMDCVDKYPETKDLVKYTLSEPIKELAPTNMAFDYSVQKPDGIKFGRGRKAVTGFKFTLKKREVRDIPIEWFEFSDEHKRLLLRLLDFKISEPSILRYAKAIGIDAITKLVREWEMKEHSNKRIDDKAKYCNAVWVRLGKKALAEVAPAPPKL